MHADVYTVYYRIFSRETTTHTHIRSYMVSVDTVLANLLLMLHAGAI
jgi:hypothetical protein